MVATPASMDTRSVVRGQFKLAHDMLEGTMADCADIADARLPGARIAAIAPIYAHTAISEDVIVNQHAGEIAALKGVHGRKGLPFQGGCLTDRSIGLG